MVKAFCEITFQPHRLVKVQQDEADEGGKGAERAKFTVSHGGSEAWGGGLGRPVFYQEMFCEESRATGQEKEPG